MWEADVVNSIIGCVDLIHSIREIRLDNKRTWIAGLARTSMVTARISALCQDVRDVAILGDDLLDELSERRVDEVCNHAHSFRLPGVERLLHETSHVLLQHCSHINLLL